MAAKKAEAISPDELAYHQTVIRQTQAAQAALQAWSAHLSAKYGLTEADMVLETGEIRRGTTV